MKLVLVSMLLLPFMASAAVMSGAQSIQLKTQNTEAGVFTKLDVQGVELSKTVGAPELPVRSFLVKAMPADVQITNMEVMESEVFTNINVMPVQEQPCRCETDKERKFAFDMSAYSKESPGYNVDYLGAFRGQPISRVDIYMASYKDSRLAVYSDVSFDINVEAFDFNRGEYKDYLIIGNEELMAGTDEFVAWKESLGYTVHTRVLLSPENELAAIQQIVADFYNQQGVDFVIFLGDANTLPMHEVSTSDGRTPSDLPYLTMDGAGDYVPDLFAGRIAALTEANVRQRLSKPVEVERKTMKNKEGFKRVIGAASDEGSNPSDDEYIRSIQEAYETIGYKGTHLAQGDPKSNPIELNLLFNEGAMWMNYMGHGSGYSWPNLTQTYSVDHIKEMRNETAVKPIVIDVACLNGRVLPGYLGTTFDSVYGQGFGASAYYGGTVNISWHPPALMSQGIGKEHVAKNFTHLGEALLAGQLYLAANWSSSEDVIDNMEWYVLQGDPGMNIHH